MAPGRAWQLIADVQAWPRWWRYVRRVRILSRGAADHVGDVAELDWSSALLYRIRLTVTTTQAEFERLLEGHAEGALRGRGTWILEPAPQGGVDVCYRWEVSLERRWMRAWSILLRPLFEWNHFTVMRAGAHGMARELGCRISGLAEWSGASR